MTNIDDSAPDTVAQGNRWRMLIAMVAYTAAVSFFESRSIMFLLNDADGTRRTQSYQLMVAGTTFLSIISYAVGFMLLAGLLDIWTGRRAQPLAALNLALPAVATFELIKMPIWVLIFQIWFWATTTS
ncbi:MAG: hypothetical protein GC190_14565 [Alphaproteobacteria bacterium]|nr:hypothetical protein [Alphaproteobacteria bacterium]